MLFFEENIFYPINHKQDHIKLSDKKVIHYKISSDRQNQRWFIAITLEDNGEITPQKQLSKQYTSYSQILSYIHILPSIVNSNKTEITIDEEMKKDLDRIKFMIQGVMDKVYEFGVKYNI